MQKGETFKLVRVIFEKKFLKYEKSVKTNVGKLSRFRSKSGKSNLKQMSDRATGGNYFLSTTKRWVKESSSVWLESEWEK